MNTSSSGMLIPDGLVYDDESALQAKIAGFVAAGAVGLHVVIDFDRTLTVRRPGCSDEVTTWDILRGHLPEEGQTQYDAAFAKYRKREIEEEMTNEDAIDWWTSNLQLFVEHGMDMNAVEAEFLQRSSIRPGAVELFKLCEQFNIPTIVMSAGIRDVIEVWGRAYGIKPTLIISTALILNDAGIVVGWERDTLVHTLNKAETDHAELANIRAARPMAILVGDSINDADMAAGDRDVLRVRIFDPRPDEQVDIAKIRQRTFSRFDAMIEASSLQPMAGLVEIIAK